MVYSKFLMAATILTLTACGTTKTTNERQIVETYQGPVVVVTPQVVRPEVIQSNNNNHSRGRQHTQTSQTQVIVGQGTYQTQYPQQMRQGYPNSFMCACNGYMAGTRTGQCWWDGQRFHMIDYNEMYQAGQCSYQQY